MSEVLPGSLLAGRTVLITGAGRGIGRAVAELAASEGARLVLADAGVDLEGNAPDASVIEELVTSLRARGVSVEGFADDIASAGVVERVVAHAIDRFDRLDVVVHAAALSVDRSVLRTPPELVERVLAVQLGAAFSLVRVAGQAMLDRKEGGSIVLFSGPSAFFGARGHAAMGAAQAGVIALARSAALELRRHRVRVNAVCPTARTRATEALPTFAAIDEASMSPAHVAAVAVFLASSLAEDVHGEAIGVAGSRTYAIRPRETTGAFGPAKPLEPREVRGVWNEALKP
ncbi:MAG: SDR family oxidoreductase [Deltaproteobacteria bacterium]|nr:SDR family oxidoreductase [Deltaproteobacteria bacterium]